MQRQQAITYAVVSLVSAAIGAAVVLVVWYWMI